MKKTILLITLIAVTVPVLLFTGCIRKNLEEAAGPITTRTYDYSGFTGVEIGSALKMDIDYGTDYSVSITAGENLFKRLHVEMNGDTLRIYTEGFSINWWWGHTTPQINITMPTLKKLDLSGASNGVISGFKSTNDLYAHVSGASDLDLDMDTGMFTADISGASNVKGRLAATGTGLTLTGASDIDLTGTGGSFKMDASGASSSSLRYYNVQDANVTLSGASDASLNISGRLDVNLSGASTFNYYGSPTMGNVQVNGASDLRNKTGQ